MCYLFHMDSSGISAIVMFSFILSSYYMMKNYTEKHVVSMKHIDMAVLLQTGCQLTRGCWVFSLSVTPLLVKCKV